MSRSPYQAIYIREEPEGPSIVFDNGVNGVVVPVTGDDLARLRRVIDARALCAKCGTPLSPTDEGGHVHELDGYEDHVPVYPTG